MKQRAFLIISSTPSLKNIAQISSHSLWLSQLIFTVFFVSSSPIPPTRTNALDSCLGISSTWSVRILEGGRVSCAGILCQMASH